MSFDSKLKKYAQLAVLNGTGLKEGQTLVINAPVNAQEFVRLCVESAYEDAKAGYVYVRWNDDLTSRLTYKHANIDRISTVDEWVIAQYRRFVDEGAAALSVYAPAPGLMDDVDGSVIAKVTSATQKAIAFYRQHMMSNQSQWSLVSIPNTFWAKKIFPDLSEEEAVNALWEAIFKAVRVSDDNDPMADWDVHNTTLHLNNDKLNQHQFSSLKFMNSVGTDIEVGLVKNHRWAGGAEKAANGQIFNPNIPTEETFTMPHKDRVNGKVVATKPLSYQGRLIDEFYFVFKDGKVVEYDAKVGKETLDYLMNSDEGARSIGEIALISHDSPISNMNILFFNTLYDENASCHMALGRAYPMNVLNGTTMSDDELKAVGMNFSNEHVDFMFGSEDMSIVGVKEDGSEVVVFKHGNFAF
ncbi:MAG: aminopeptidase [Erysipelotrichaceae bacterium]|nr:aminopeptidase [Erysipelotrichaceae bacterium]